MVYQSLIKSYKPSLVTASKLFQQASSTATRSIIMGRLKPFAQKKRPASDRSKRALKSKKIVSLVREAIENDEPNFSVGTKKLYLPFATIRLLRPNAKITPYQAKFIVPKSFNKLDLRDYLYHIYNLRVLNITSTLGPAIFTRSMPAPYGGRYRDAQVKKMTVDLVDPFVWPAESEEFKQEESFSKELTKYRDEKSSAVNSNMNKPSTAFEGIIDKQPRAMNFIPKNVRRQMRNTKRKDIALRKRLDTENFIDQYIPLQ